MEGGREGGMDGWIDGWREGGREGGREAVLVVYPYVHVYCVSPSVEVYHWRHCAMGC